MKNILIVAMLLISANYSFASSLECENGEPVPVLFFKPDLRYGYLAFFELGRGGFPVDPKSFYGSQGNSLRQSIKPGKSYLTCGKMTSDGFLFWKISQ